MPHRYRSWSVSVRKMAFSSWASIFCAALLWTSIESRALDPSTEVRAMSEKALRQFQATLDSTKASIREAIEQEQGWREVILEFRTKGSSEFSLSLDSCPPDVINAQEKLLQSRAAQVAEQLSSARTRQVKEFEQWFAEWQAAENAKAEFPRRVSLYSEAIWADMRRKMLDVLTDLYELDVKRVQLTIMNGCLSREILGNRKKYAEAQKTEAESQKKYFESQKKYFESRKGAEAKIQYKDASELHAQYRELYAQCDELVTLAGEAYTKFDELYTKQTGAIAKGYREYYEDSVRVIFSMP